MLDDETIPNWTSFGVHFAAIELFRYFSEEEDSYYYNAHVTLSLDDGECEEFDKTTTLITEHYDDDPIRCAMVVSFSLMSLFNISRYIMIFDADQFDEGSPQIAEFYLPEEPDSDETIEIIWLNKNPTEPTKKSKLISIL
jgi:hypothetical protein